MIIVRPDNVRIISCNLDHPESVYLLDDGTIYAGGEAGQIYRINIDGSVSEIASTGGNILGLVLDADEAIYAADYARHAVFRIRDGKVELYSSGTSRRAMRFPNQPLFAADGTLYVTDSGDYWDSNGTGCVFAVRPGRNTELFHSGPFRFANGCALHPKNGWLYIAETPASRIVRIPTDRPDGPVELAWQLPDGWLPDGIWFTDDGRLLVACYRPDQIALCCPDGTIEVVARDPTAEILIAPTNLFIHSGEIYVANLGGYHLTAIPTTLRAGPVFRPRIPEVSTGL
jgi:gluconolactonase